MHQGKCSAIKNRSVIYLCVSSPYRCAFLYLMAALLCFTSFGRVYAANPAAPPSTADCTPLTAAIERRVDYNATTYGITCQDCRIEWIARDTEVGVVKLWSQCALPLSQQMPLIERMYAEFLRTDRNAGALRTLFLGEIDPDTASGPRDISIRLALGAHRSSEWDARRGDARNGNINGFVKDLANREMIYPELKELFGRFHQNIQVAYVEKVLVQRADKLSYYDRLKKQGVQPSDRLPFDCMTWFTIAAQ